MKKRVKGLFLGAACVFLLAGCGGAENAEAITEGTVEEYAQKAHEMLEEADGFAATFLAEMQMKDMGENVTEGMVTLVKEPFFVNVDATLTFDDLVQEYDLYLEETEEAVNQYMSYDGEWTEMTMDKETAMLGTQIYNTLYNMEAIFSAAENWTAEKQEDVVVLTGVIPEMKVYDVETYTHWFQLAGMSGLAEVYYAGVGDVPVTVTLNGKTGEPLSYRVDLAKQLETMTNNVLMELGGGTLEDPVEVEMYVIASELTQLGGVEAGEIPVEARNDAINYEKEISMLENQ